MNDEWWICKMLKTNALQILILNLYTSNLGNLIKKSTEFLLIEKPRRFIRRGFFFIDKV